ncbi:hypothetical protein AX17_001735 [Amanita inopinata Kibby_2008]|nr:hypothetical protein AX17_001735 [Amanita inopinata Kibby_2008]
MDPTHVLSAKSKQQNRNIFIWCSSSRKLAMGWHVDDESPVTVSTAYRWVTTAVLTQYPEWKAAETYALFPVALRPNGVLMNTVHRNGESTLSRESQDIMLPGDYGLYDIGMEYFSIPISYNP